MLCTPFLFASGLGQLVSNPGSPSRLNMASQSPAYPMMPLGAPGPSLVPQVGVGVPAAMARLQPLPQQQQPIEKNRLCKLEVTVHTEINYSIRFACLYSCVVSRNMRFALLLDQYYFALHGTNNY